MRAKTKTICWSQWISTISLHVILLYWIRHAAVSSTAFQALVDTHHGKNKEDTQNTACHQTAHHYPCSGTTGLSRAVGASLLQWLWSDFGSIRELNLEGAAGDAGSNLLKKGLTVLSCGRASLGRVMENQIDYNALLRVGLDLQEGEKVWIQGCCKVKTRTNKHKGRHKSSCGLWFWSISYVHN